jgi:hypothetical protein
MPFNTYNRYIVFWIRLEAHLVKNVMVYIYWTFMFSLVSIKFKASSWSWSYGSWIYNYLCNQCLSPPKLWVRIALMTIHDDVYSIQHYVIKFVSDLWQVCGFLWVLRFPPPIKLTDTIYCNWNIVASINTIILTLNQICGFLKAAFYVFSHRVLC